MIDHCHELALNHNAHDIRKRVAHARHQYHIDENSAHTFTYDITYNFISE